MKDGDISIHKVVQPDGSFKTRPVLLLKQMRPFGDWIVCAISTQLKQEVKDFDFIMEDKNASFKLTGLKSSSLVRLGFINTIDKKSIPGTIGQIPENIIKSLQQRLANQLLK